VDERFETDLRAGYPDDASGVVLGSPMLDGEVLAGVRVRLPLRTVNRHGLVAGATGTGKTKTLQVIAGQLSDAGVPVFVADIKGDLSGLAQPIDAADPKVAERAASLGWTVEPRSHPVEPLSLTGEAGAPVRATVESFGPVLLAKVLDLNETQTAVLSLVFRLCDDRDLPLLDLADVRTTLRFLTSDEGKPVLEEYGGISKASVGVVLRSILMLEEAGAGAFFGEPAFDVADLLRRDSGRGVISLLELADVMDRPRLFSTFMLWLLARLYATLPEIGDTAEPVLAFFFDEAHLLFDDASDALLEQIELTARLIRSKGVGVFFVTHTPTNVPPPVLSQLGNRVQHALRAFTPKDADDLRKTARTFPITDHYDVEESLTSLGIGEALVTVLSPDGVPSPLAWTRIVPPDSRMAPADEAVLSELVAGSPLRVKYLVAPDRPSAHEILGERLASADAVAATPPPPKRRERSVFGTLHVPRR
jgi:DNA helicase HerA-like ATPase